MWVKATGCGLALPLSFASQPGGGAAPCHARPLNYAAAAGAAALPPACWTRGLVAPPAGAIAVALSPPAPACATFLAPTLPHCCLHSPGAGARGVDLGVLIQRYGKEFVYTDAEVGAW